MHDLASLKYCHDTIYFWWIGKMTSPPEGNSKLENRNRMWHFDSTKKIVKGFDKIPEKFFFQCINIINFWWVPYHSVRTSPRPVNKLDRSYEGCSISSWPNVENGSTVKFFCLCWKLCPLWWTFMLISEHIVNLFLKATDF